MIEFDASFAIMYELMIDEAAIWFCSDEYEIGWDRPNNNIDWPWRDVSSDQRRSIAHGR